jgi:hypothetical protein
MARLQLKVNDNSSCTLSWRRRRRPEAVDRDVAPIQPAKQDEQRHVGKRLASLEPRKDEVSALPSQTLQERKRRRRQWHAMLPLAFHAIGRDRPHPLLPFDLRPARAVNGLFTLRDGTTRAAYLEMGQSERLGPGDPIPMRSLVVPRGPGPSHPPHGSTATVQAAGRQSPLHWPALCPRMRHSSSTVIFSTVPLTNEPVLEINAAQASPLRPAVTRISPPSSGISNSALKTVGPSKRSSA